MSIPLKPDDPCYWMLTSPHIKRQEKPIHRDGCYICEDPEFQMMGLPLCYCCEKCKGHVPADDSVCDDCGHDHIPEEKLDENC